MQIGQPKRSGRVGSQDRLGVGGERPRSHYTQYPDTPHSHEKHRAIIGFARLRAQCYRAYGGNHKKILKNTCICHIKIISLHHNLSIRSERTLKITRMNNRKVYVVVNIRNFSCNLVTLKKDVAYMAGISVPTLVKHLNKSGGTAIFGFVWIFQRTLTPAKTGKWA